MNPSQFENILKELFASKEAYVLIYRTAIHNADFCLEVLSALVCGSPGFPVCLADIRKAIDLGKRRPSPVPALCGRAIGCYIKWLAGCVERPDIELQVLKHLQSLIFDKLLAAKNAADREEVEAAISLVAETEEKSSALFISMNEWPQADIEKNHQLIFELESSKTYVRAILQVHADLGDANARKALASYFGTL